MTIEHQKPHIVVTDIRFNEKDEKDGLDLVKTLSEKYTDVRSILISGYQRFEYAQTAIQYGVKNYLLKPVNGEELNKCLEIVAGDIRSNLKLREDTPSSKSAREYFLLKLAYNNPNFITYSTDYVNEKFAYHFSDGFFLLGIIKLDDLQQVYRKAESDFEKICELFKNLFGELSSDLEIVLENPKVENFVFILNFSKENKTRVYSRLKRFRELISTITKRHKNINVTLALSDAEASLGKLVSSYAVCTALIDGRVIYGVNKILMTSDLSVGMKEEKISLDLENYNFSRYIDLLDIKGMKMACLTLFKETMPQFIRTPQKVTVWFYELFSSFIGCMKRYHGDYIVKDVEEYEYIRKLRHYSSVEDLEQAFLSTAVDCMQDYIDHKHRAPNQMIQEIDRYIFENYASKISLESIAQHVHLSSAYLGILYKKEMNTNITDAIAMVRIEKAKERLSQSDDSITEIAASVGYKDIKSFRKQFLKIVGVTPSEYREFHR